MSMQGKISLRHSLKVRQSLPILLGLCVGLILMLWLGYNYAARYIINTAEAQMNQFASSISRQDDYITKSSNRGLRLLVEAVEYMLTLPQEEWSEQEENIIAAIPNDTARQNLRIVWIENETVRFLNYSGLGRESQSSTEQSNDTSGQVQNLGNQWTTERVRNVQVDELNSVIIDRNRELIMQVSSVLKNENNEIFGFITLSFSLNWYTDRINSFSFFEESYPFFVANNGNWTLPAEYDESLASLKDEIMRTSRGDTILTWQNEPYVCIYLPNINKTFIIGVLVPKSEILASLDATTGVLSLIGVIILFFSAYGLNRTYKSLLSPLKPLSHMANDLAHGDIDIHTEMQYNDSSDADSQTSFYLSAEEKLKVATSKLRSALKQRTHDLTIMAKTQERIKGELLLARRIQENLRPKQLPELPNLKLATYVHTSHEIHGDMYDCVQLSEQKICIIIGNIAEHGVPGAILAGKIMPLIDELIHSEHSPSQVLEILNNNSLQISSITTSFTSLLLCVFDVQSGILTFASAGYISPYILRNENNSNCLTQIKWTEDIPLGIKSNVQYGEHNIQLEANDILLFLTPQLLSVQNSEQKVYAQERLDIFIKDIPSKTLYDISLHELLHKIIEDVQCFSQQDVQNDTVLIAMSWKGRI